MPVRLLIGNHDTREVFRDHFPDQALDPSGFVQSACDTSAGRFLLLDTVLAGTHAGHYCQERRTWLAEALATAEREGHEVFLFMHHPPFATGIPAMDRISQQDADDFWTVVAPHRGRIRHLFFGHVHRPMAGNWQGISFSTVRATNHQVWFGFSTEEIQGSFEPPAYGVVLIDAASIVVHMHDFLDDSDKFSLHDSPWDDWSRGPGGAKGA